jgi:hypothetical protein
MMTDERVYTRMSGLAVKGLQRLVRDREIYVRDEGSAGFTVITKGSHHKAKGGWSTKRKLERLSA